MQLLYYYLSASTVEEPPHDTDRASAAAWRSAGSLLGQLERRGLAVGAATVRVPVTEAPRCNLRDLLPNGTPTTLHHVQMRAVTRLHVRIRIAQASQSSPETASVSREEKWPGDPHFIRRDGYPMTTLYKPVVVLAGAPSLAPRCPPSPAPSRCVSRQLPPLMQFCSEHHTLSLAAPRRGSLPSALRPPPLDERLPL